MHDLANLWPAILGMAVVTYGTRVGGLSLVSFVNHTPRLARLLQHLATGVLTALVVAGVREGGAAIAIAAVMAMILMRTSGRMLAAIGAAAATAALVRLLIP